jgi:hypothetical protein
VAIYVCGWPADRIQTSRGSRGRAPPSAENVRLWFYTDEVDGLYEHLKARQLGEAREVLEGRPVRDEAIRFDEELYDPFYGGRQASIRDPHARR